MSRAIDSFRRAVLGLSSRRADPAPRRPARRRARRRAWAPEGLEDRVLLAASLDTVDAITDTGSGSGHAGDLRYVLGLANADPNPAGSLIEFDPKVFAAPRTITRGRP
jgi:hypothetical protein